MAQLELQEEEVADVEVDVAMGGGSEGLSEYSDRGVSS
jgi:hypothetical protein